MKDAGISPSLLHAREGSRRDLVFGWPRRGPDHEAVIRFGGEAPRRRAHSHLGMTTMQLLGLPPPRIVIGGRHTTGTKSVVFALLFGRSGRPAQHDTLRDFPGRDHARAQ